MHLPPPQQHFLGQSVLCGSPGCVGGAGLGGGGVQVGARSGFRMFLRVRVHHTPKEIRYPAVSRHSTH